MEVRWGILLYIRRGSHSGIGGLGQQQDFRRCLSAPAPGPAGNTLVSSLQQRGVEETLKIAAHARVQGSGGEEGGEEEHTWYQSEDAGAHRWHHEIEFPSE